MTKEKFAIGKYYEKTNGSKIINIGKGVDVPFRSRDRLRITRKGQKLIIEVLN